MGTVTFGPWDYVVFGLMLAGSTLIGIYYAVKTRKGRSTNEYLVASNSMTFLPVALSLIATSESSVMMLGSPAESYAFGIELILGEIGNAVGTIIEVIVTLTFLKRLNLSTPFELQYMSVVIYGQAIAIEQVRHTVWNLFFGRILAGFGYLYMPSSLQRISSAKSLKETRRALLVTIPAFPILLLIGLSQGIVAYGYYYHIRCDPVESKQINSLNQIVYTLLSTARSPLNALFYLGALFPFANAKNIVNIRHLLTCDASHHLARSMILSRLDYCNSLLGNVNQDLVTKLQRVQNAAVRTITRSRKRSHITPVLVKLHWLPIKARIEYKILCITYRCIKGSAPSYLTNLGAITGLLAGVSFMLWLSLGSMFSSAGSASTYLPSAPTDNCPGFNVTASSFVNSTTTILLEQEEVVKNS
ncbi:uncharacterized protein LOC124269737 [Haliotis rubra]|uniref:uncharacterized protein LOC124269737 n=1 Tax=Haliotis rubra TaxID=36100 RepID=UPI001EE4FAA6|nr:uncharacterized protein LOC124269737 [Haliotis rubra]